MGVRLGPNKTLWIEAENQWAIVGWTMPASSDSLLSILMWNWKLCLHLLSLVTYFPQGHHQSKILNNPPPFFFKNSPHIVHFVSKGKVCLLLPRIFTNLLLSPANWSNKLASGMPASSLLSPEGDARKHFKEEYKWAHSLVRTCCFSGSPGIIVDVHLPPNKV